MKFKVKDYKTGEVWYEDENGKKIPVTDENLEQENDADIIDKVNEFSLQTLRKIARGVGVKSPTTMSKDELIDAIISVSTGEIEPQKNETRVGRPPNNSDEMSAYNFFKYEVGSNLPDIEEFLDRPIKLYSAEELSDNFIINCPPMMYNEDLKKEREIREGYLEVMPEGYGRIRVDGYKLSDKDICISEFLVKKFKLRSGQYIKGRCRKFQERKPEVMYDLLGVDGQVEKNEDIVKFEDLDYLPLSNNINFSNKVLDFEILKGITVENIKFGGKYLVKNIDKTNIIEKTSCFVKTIANHNKVRVIYLQNGARPEEKAIEYNKVDCIRIPYGEVATQAKAIITLIWEKAKRYTECGENVVLVMPNYTDALKIFNRAITGHINVPISSEAWDMFKKSIEMAKNASNGGTLTLIAFDNLMLTKDLVEFVDTELLPYFDDIFQI